MENRDLTAFNKDRERANNNGCITNEMNEQLKKKYGPRFLGWLLENMGQAACKQKFYNTLMLRFKGLTRTGLDLLYRRDHSILPLRTFDNMLDEELEKHSSLIRYNIFDNFDSIYCLYTYVNIHMLHAFIRIHFIPISVILTSNEMKQCEIVSYKQNMSVLTSIYSYALDLGYHQYGEEEVSHTLHLGYGTHTTFITHVFFSTYLFYDFHTMYN